MIDWLHGLSIGLLAVVVCTATAIVTAAIFTIVTRLAVGKRAASFSAVSPGLLPPMALIFGLLIGFLAAEVWSDNSNAQVAVNREASALRTVNLLTRDFPGADQRRMDALIRTYIQLTITREWPAMAHQNATLLQPSPQLASALQLALSLPARNSGQVVAQREIVSSMDTALDARRQRILISESSVNWAKWAGVIGLGILTLIAVAFVHSADRGSAAIAMTLFASAIAASVLMIAVQDRPFAGPFRVQPTPLVQVLPAPS
ncbi:MAG TPA: hypothetical protein VGP69_01860 [Gaiellaceae bacterium]|nr:hypothetical protein [Gaiellaceae bacterium]